MIRINNNLMKKMNLLVKIIIKLVIIMMILQPLLNINLIKILVINQNKYIRKNMKMKVEVTHIYLVTNTDLLIDYFYISK